MGLDMYLSRVKLYGHSLENARVVDAFLDLKEYNATHEEQFDLKEWCGADPADLKLDALEALRPEYQMRYPHWDTEKRCGYKTIFEQVGYWRKANAIHRWFVKNVQNGTDDCGTYVVSQEQLEELKALCEDVLNDKVSALKALPTTSGFFFGSTAYDEYYIQDLHSTVEIINQVLETTDWDTQTVCYQSSW